MFNIIQKFINTLRKGEGYISVEVVIVAGLMIGIGTYAIFEFYQVGRCVSDESIEKVNLVSEIFLSEAK